MTAVTVDATSTGKPALRRRLRQTRRDRLRDRDMEAEATALADHVMALVGERTGSRVCRVAAFESLPTEPPTQLLVQRLTSAGYEVVVPVTLPDRDLDWQVAGTTTPLGLNAIHDSEIVLVPALAADSMGTGLVRAVAPTTAPWPGDDRMRCWSSCSTTASCFPPARSPPRSTTFASTSP
jgi:5-formyltetrahydrofolate cyclo-ligase